MTEDISNAWRIYRVGGSYSAWGRCKIKSMKVTSGTQVWNFFIKKPIQLHVDLHTTIDTYISSSKNHLNQISFATKNEGKRNREGYPAKGSSEGGMNKLLSCN